MDGLTSSLPLAGLGLLLLMGGGQLVVREAATLAARLGVPPLVIGVVVIGFGTSAPELATAIRAASAGAPALAFGNAIGASLANLLLVLPLAAALAPIMVARAAVWQEAAAMIVAAAMVAGLALVPGAAQAGGGVMLALLGAWLMINLLREAGRGASAQARLQQKEGAALVVPAQSWWLALLLLAGGIALLVTGADLLVTAASRAARQLGIGEDVLGLTLLSFGTCLPELTTAVIAARRGQTDIVVGNVLGSCLFNLLAVAGVVQLVACTGPTGMIRTIDAPALLLAAMLVSAVLLTRQRVGRPMALGLFALYALWLAIRLGS